MVKKAVVKIEAEIAKAFELNIAEVQEMVKKYQTLTLVPDDKESYEICRKALTSCIRTRTGINKRRLELNKEDQDRIKGRNAAANQLASIIEPAETHLQALVKGEDARLKAIEDAKEEAERLKVEGWARQLAEYRVILPYMELAVMTDEEFDTALFDAKEEFEENERRKAEAEAARKAEEERLAAQKKAQDLREAELKKQADDIAAKQKEEAEKLADQQKAIESGKRTARGLAIVTTGFYFDHDNEVFTFEGMDDISLEKVLSIPDSQFFGYIEGLSDMVALCKKEQAETEARKAKAAEDEKRWRSRLELLDGIVWNGQWASDAETEEKVILYEDLIGMSESEFQKVAKVHNKAVADMEVARKAKEADEKALMAAEEEKRQEALRPIKDRIHDYADDLLKETPPVFKDPAAQELMKWAEEKLFELITEIKERAENL